MLAELHLHLHGCVAPEVLLHHIAGCQLPRWDWYETEFENAFGFRPPARRMVERFRDGHADVLPAFTDLMVMSDEDAGSFDRFQAKANLHWVGTDWSGDGRVREVLAFADAVRADLLAQGVTHVEYRTFPLPGVLDAFARDRGPLTQRLVVTLPRDDPWPPWELVKELALGRHGAALTAIDWSGREEGHPPKRLAAVFADIKAFNRAHPERALAILAHVGESFTDKSLESAIRWVQEVAELGAHRLGHALVLGIDPASFGEHVRTETVAERRDQIAYDLNHCGGLGAAGVDVDPDALNAELARLEALDDDGVLEVAYDRTRLAEVRRRQDFAIQRVLATGAVIEVCPTSNRRIAGIRDPGHHPLHRFLVSGLPVIISTDNPGVFGITLPRELDWVCGQTGGGDDLRRRLAESAWRARAECLPADSNSRCRTRRRRRPR